MTIFSIYKLFFLFFSSNILVSAFLVILSLNPIHSVLGLIFAFFNASCLLILIDAEFLAYLFLIVYVGAIAVLFLFVIMMLELKEIETKSNFKLEFYHLIILYNVVAFGIGYLLFGQNSFDISEITPGIFNYDFSRYTIPHTQAYFLGKVLYTKYISYFIVAALILLVAMIGAIVITTEFNEFVKRQRPIDQIGRSSKGIYFKFFQEPSSINKDIFF